MKAKSLRIYLPRELPTTRTCAMRTAQPWRAGERITALSNLLFESGRVCGSAALRSMNTLTADFCFELRLGFRPADPLGFAFGVPCRRFAPPASVLSSQPGSLA